MSIGVQLRVRAGQARGEGPDIGSISVACRVSQVASREVMTCSIGRADKL